MREIFNLKTKPQIVNLYNGPKPFVLMDIGSDYPGRGDTNGYKGIAQRVAKKLGADFLFLDHAILEEMYPSSKLRADRLLKLFQDKGYPDFIFSTNLPGLVDEHLAKHSKGSILFIESWNESLSASLDMRDQYPREIVPHHLSPDVLRTEGQRFAQEYEELPRPFIGINLVDGWLDGRTKEKLAGLRSAYDSASFFICSCHRTDAVGYAEYVSFMQDTFKDSGGRFPLIDFNYNFHANNYGLDETWNPYAGLLDQADHLIVVGSSLSMIAEPLATGKVPHSTFTEYYDGMLHRGYLKNLFSYETGAPLVTERIRPIDITEECADKIIERHKVMKALDLKEKQGTALKKFLIRNVLGKKSPKILERV